jgi:hypothetical protein
MAVEEKNNADRPRTLAKLLFFLSLTASPTKKRSTTFHLELFSTSIPNVYILYLLPYWFFFFFLLCSILLVCLN